MEKGGMDPPPPYNYQPPPPGSVPPEPMQPGYGVGAMPPPQAGAYPAQPGAYPPQQQFGQQPTTVTTVIVAPRLAMFGAHPVQITCVKCNAHVMTETKTVAGMLTWLICGGLAFIGCWLGCCLIPFCVDDCQDIEHWCPNCKQHLGTYKRLN